MEFEKIVMERYATKKFDGRMVDEAKMKKLMQIIRYSASSLNLQPWKIKVITDKETKEKLKAHSYNQEQITSCSHLLVFCADTDLEAKMNAVQKQMLDAGVPKENVDGFMGMVGGFLSQLGKEHRLPWAQRQVFLALGNALNGAKALGLDSCPMEGFVPHEYAKILGLPKNLVPTVVCPIGYAADKQRKKIRLGEKDVFF